MGVPDLTAEQRAAAAARAVRARQVRAAVRAGLATGELPVRVVLLDGQADDERGRILARMRVVDLLSSFRGIGPVRAAELMARIGIATNRRVGGLGIRQAEAVATLIEARQQGAGGPGPTGSAGSAGIER